MSPEKLQKTIQECFQRDFERVLFGDGGTSTTTESPTLDLRKILPEWEKMLRNARRTAVTFVVDLAHPGPPIQYETPNDGTRIECSWVQANAIHQHWPLKLLEVLSAEAAEFAPAVAGELVAKHLPCPPFERARPTGSERAG